MRSHFPGVKLFVLVYSCLWAASVVAQDQDVNPNKDSQKPAEIDASVDRALSPLFARLRDAKSTRATVELSADTFVDGAMIARETSVYQIASIAPDQFTIYFKSESQRTRVYCDGKTGTIAFSPTEYTELADPLTIPQAVLQLPIALGPYPEIVLALTLAGNDPAVTLVSGMKQLEASEEEMFRGKTPSIRVRGVQDDDVTWDLWMTQDEKRTPLRLQVDLTEMLRANGDLELPSGYRYVLRFDFKHWLIDHQNAPELFRYSATAESKKYESVNAYLNRERE